MAKNLKERRVYRKFWREEREGTGGEEKTLYFESQKLTTKNNH